MNNVEEYNLLEAKRIYIYNILNEIRPVFQQTRYPYNYWSPEKITETKKNIELVWSKDKKFLMNASKQKKGGAIPHIYVF